MSLFIKNIDLEKLRHFYLIFRARSIKAVAEEHNISVSILRHSLITIEKKLDIKLYYPSKKNFVPTEASKELFKVCREIIELLDAYENKEDVSNASPSRQELIICSSTTFTNYYLPPILSRLNKSHPEVDFKVFCDSTPNASEYGFDVLIGSRISNTNLSEHKLGTFDFKFYGSPRLKEKLQHLQSPEELRGEDLLLYGGGHHIDKSIIERNNVKLVSNSYPFLLHMCAQGLGILSSFDSQIFKRLHLGIDIEEIFPNVLAEQEDAYFYYNRFTDKLSLINSLLSETKNLLQEVEEDV